MNLSAPLTDKANALECLTACQRVYLTPTLSTDSAHVLIVQLPNCILVAFRGSQSIEDWIHDAEFQMLTISGGKVHTGIWFSACSIAGRLDDSLRALPRLPIILCGHSLGGGQAIDIAYNFETRFEIHSVITFGSPGTGNAQFADSYNNGLKEKTIRFVNGRDIVSRLPGEDLGYAHVGQEGFLPSTGGFELNPSIWQLLEDDVRGAVTDVESGHLELLNDHHLERYFARLEALTLSTP